MHIELQNINKSFGSVQANKDISLTFNAGCIIGVLGENGAGKSTLMKILSGYQGADSGKILIDGTPTDFSKPQVAISNGIGMLQQDPLDVGAFTVLENFIYGQVHSNPFFSRHKARKILHEYATKFDFELDPDTLIGHLSIAQRQQLEIVRLLAQGVNTLILDEPTTGISAEQKDKLFNALRSLAESGAIILLVSHKLEDVMALCHEVVVLRAGELVGQANMPLTQSEIVRMMFGDDIAMPTIERESLTTRPIILQVDKLHATDGRLTVENFDLTIQAGEIVGFAGLDGSGQELIMRVCAGLMSPMHGKAQYKERDVRQSDYSTLYREGLIYGAAGRIEEGLIAGLTLTEHITLAEQTKLFVDWSAMHKLTRERIAHYQVRGRAEDTIESLSGGNQQRVLMAMMPENPALMILEAPTRGLDVDSANWIWQQLLARCQHGAGLLFTSPELDEIVRYSHRIVVFYAGKTYMVNDPAAITTEQLGHLIGGEF